MAIKLVSATHRGLDGVLIDVEIDIMKGIPAFNIVGLPDASVKEAKDRVRAAIVNSGFEFPLGRITINLAPADVRKIGTLLDLPIAIGILMESKQINQRKLDNYLIFGELSLSGDLLGVKGAIPIIFEGEKNEKNKYIFPFDNIKEIKKFLVGEFYPFKNLKQVISYLENEDLLPHKISSREEKNTRSGLDFEEIIGQYTSKRAMEIVAAGRHNILMFGSPGSGKSMLAKALPTILPPLTLREEKEIAKIYSMSGDWREDYFMERPFRAPHHTIPKTSLIGGGREIKVGEITLAHNGVLFLDEILEFKRENLEVMREPLEEGQINISRLRESYILPSKFILIGAFNPCPCGLYLDEGSNGCKCSEGERRRYINRLSRALSDRVDIFNFVPRIKHREITDKKDEVNSEVMRKRVVKAQSFQEERLRGTEYLYNGDIKGKDVLRLCKLNENSKKILEAYYIENNISLRGYTKIIKVARTIADLDGEEIVKEGHVLEAIGYRRNLFGEIV